MSFTLERVPSSTRRSLTARRPAAALRSRGLTVATAGVLVAGLALNVGVGPSSAEDGAGDRGLTWGTDNGYRGRNQTSDGKPGVLVGPPVNARGKAPVITNDVSYEIAPGVTLREWDQVDGRQPVGQVRMNLVSVSLDAPNISFEELSPTFVTSRKTVSQLGSWDQALTAVNGDFFDIGRTNAPLGTSVDREAGLLTGSREGWIPDVNSTLWFDAAGPHVSPITVQNTIRQRRKWSVSGINHPSIPAGEIGVFTHAFNRTPGYQVTGGKKRAREVVLRKNRVVSNRPKLSSGKKIGKKDKVLIGTGQAAGKLKTLRKGKKITVATRFDGGKPTVAISGDRPVLVNGVRTVINNTIAHPRTAVGIDADGRKLLILVVDGRSAVSRGYTMVELADMMTALGAENAINLDGGGSSTMYTRNGTGGFGVVNEPSDGTERLVPNAFGVVYNGELPPVVPILPPTTVPPTTPPTTTP